MKSQFATSREDGLFAGQDGGRRKLPFAFTEGGIVCYLLSSEISTLLSYEDGIPLRCPHRASNNKMSIRSFCFYAAMVRTFLCATLEDAERYLITVCFGSARNIK